MEKVKSEKIYYVKLGQEELQTIIDCMKSHEDLNEDEQQVLQDLQYINEIY